MVSFAKVVLNKCDLDDETIQGARTMCANQVRQPSRARPSITGSTISLKEKGFLGRGSKKQFSNPYPSGILERPVSQF